MKLPTWRGKLPQWNGKKPARTPGRHLCGPAPSGWGGYSVAAAAIVVVIAVVANLLVNALPAGATQFDISARSMFTMSQETRAAAGWTGPGHHRLLAGAERPGG